ncbi:MAG: serine--tRNA ligase [Clostridia bacterium]|nr:serine--tRNA ligase [Clostridia bacterium]
MLDIKRIKENPKYAKERLATRQKDYSAEIDRLLQLDVERRALIADTEAKKAEQNKISKQIPLFKKEGKDVAPIFAEMKVLSETVKAETEKIDAIDSEIQMLLLSIPNMPNETVPVGKDDSENKELRRWSEPREFGFEPKAHWDIGKDLKILDPDTAAKITGTRFHVYRGMGSRLERAVINYYLDTHTDHGYTEIFPPFMVNRDSMKGTGQLPKFEEDAFRVANNDCFLIPTAEVPVTNMHRDDILDGAELPISYCAYSACFRAEAGSAGRDTRGLIRQHQFNKVELVKFTTPESSYDELEKLTNDAERVLQGLGLPYRVVQLSTGDLGFSSAMTYDIEVWMPSYGRYVEISSCSDFEDYQARRANIRYRESPKDKPRLVHTLNGSGVAVGRTVAAILENYQNEDGTVTIPEALQPYMGCTVIRPEK